MNPALACAVLLIGLYISQPTATEAAVVAGGGQWSLLQSSIGVSAMHMQLLRNDRVIIFDRTDFGRSNLSLPDGKCRNDPRDLALKHDCTAHSVEYDVAGNSFRPLTVLTDTWCSSGAVAADGRLIQTGGFNDGDRAVRFLQPCDDRSCDWVEKPATLGVRRWYASNQILPGGGAIIVGGTGQFNYEFYPKSSNSGAAVFNLPFLVQTKDPEENNLYPFLHLNVDGNLFIFANNRAILFDFKANKIVKTYPIIPGGEPRNYPSSGSSVLLPINPSGAEAEVLVCGGAPRGSYRLAARSGTFVKALTTCGRIKITDSSPEWEMEHMPAARVMGDMVLLPTGEDVLIVNGAGTGSAGWELGRDPVLEPVNYRPAAPRGTRFDGQLSPSTIPRMYHSTAVLLRDGRVLVGGSNPHAGYEFTDVMYPTELSLEAFSPDYLRPSAANFRPTIITDTSTPVAAALKLWYGQPFGLRIEVGVLRSAAVRVTMVAPAFATHSFSMNQRLVILENTEVMRASETETAYDVTALAPANGNIAPPGYYMLFVVNEGVPSEGIWVHLSLA